jgi:hypothetical protein
MMPVVAYEVRIQDGQVAIRYNARDAGGTLREVAS